jgi:hypothetical protein
MSWTPLRRRSRRLTIGCLFLFPCVRRIGGKETLGSLGRVCTGGYTSGVKPGFFGDLCRATGSRRNEATCQQPKLEEYKREPGIKSIKVRSFSWCSPPFQENRGYRDPEVISRRSNCVSPRCLHGLNRCISTTMSRLEKLTAPSERTHRN